jgi:hypothetical protein
MANKKPGLDPLGLANPKKSNNKKGLKKPSGLDPLKVANPQTFGQAFAAARKKLGAGKTFTYKGKKYSTNRADDKKKTTTSSTKKYGMGQVDSLSKSKVKQGPPKGPLKQKKPGFFDRFKSDFKKAVKETKRNFGITEPKKKNTMDFGAPKKKTKAPMYESKGSKIKMAKGYSAGGRIFTGR